LLDVVEFHSLPDDAELELPGSLYYLRRADNSVDPLQRQVRSVIEHRFRICFRGAARVENILVASDKDPRELIAWDMELVDKIINMTLRVEQDMVRFHTGIPVKPESQPAWDGIGFEKLTVEANSVVYRDKRIE